MTFALAPATVVRACAWRADTLDPFGADGLGGSSAAEGAAHDEVVDRERDALWERTAGDPRFMKALAFSSPSLVDRVALFASRRKERSKRVRHLETSLYRYLARAASRTTPSGLWAGVALARFGKGRDLRRAPTRYSVAPDLAPFAAALRAIGERKPYRDRAKWCVNPTLRRSPQGTFGLLVRLPNGALSPRELDAAGVAPLVARARTGAGTLGDWAARTGVPWSVADAWAEAGALVGGASLPAWFESAWGALDAACSELLPADGAAWRGATAGLARIASGLAEDLDRIAPADVTAALDEARGIVTELLARLDVRAGAPEVPLRCDLGLPFEITFGPELREEIQETLVCYQREWLDGASPMARPRAERRRALVEGLAERGVPIGASFPAALAHPLDSRRPQPIEPEPEAGRTSSARPGSDSDLQAPWGCFIARLGERGVAQVFGVDDNPAATFARYGELLGRQHDLTRWLAARIEGLRADHGMDVADLIVPLDANPNALARADVGASRIEPWGTSGIDLLGAELRAEHCALVCATERARLMVLSLSSANVMQDALVEQLLLTGFQERVGAVFRAASLRLEGEGESLEYAAAFTLSNGSVVRARRSVLTGKHLAGVVAGRGARRHAAWRSIAGKLGWPDRVTLSIDGGPPLLVSPSSPLAIEAVLEGARDARCIVVEDAGSGGRSDGAGTAWLDGRVADVAVPFSRARHALSGFERSDA